MARTAGEIQADIDALQGVMATGARAVQFTDHSITYNSYADMQTALSDLQAQLGIVLGGRRIRRVRMQTSKGLGNLWLR